jgi:SAM-dependent MidA family methyltransferase
VGIADVIRTEIERDGPIGFDRYVELALYGPGGYYERPPVGPAGDFVTSPHVHPVFGHLLGSAIAELWALLERPDPLVLADHGAGDGTLARQLLAAASELPIDYVAVERSPGAREALERIGGVRVAEELPEACRVVLAHEVLDNLPFKRVREGREVRVGLDAHGGFEEVEVAAADELLELAGGATDTVVPVGALAWIDDVAARLADPGYVLVIDYGGVGEPGGPPHGYRRHRVVEDLLAEPGATDITSGVDLALVAERARSRGLAAFPPVTQRHALTALGIDTWLKDELARQAELLDGGRGIEAVRTWSGRSRATLLVDPSGLGRLMWLVLATHGLPAPSFVA